MEATAIMTGLMSPAGHHDPYPYYEALHQLGPVTRLPTGTVVVNGYDEVDAVLRNRSARVKDTDLLDRTWPGWRAHEAATLQAAAMVFDSTDGHSRVRRLISQAFTPRRVAALEPAVHSLTQQILDRMQELGGDGTPVDFVAEFAYRLPSAVICALLGIPQDDALWIRKHIDTVTVFLEPDAPLRDMTEADASAAELSAYLERLIAERRRHPGDDLVSALVRVRDQSDGSLTESELVSNISLLVLAGSQTTTDLLGTSMWLLAQHPSHAEALAQQPGHALSYVQETLRYDAPVQLTMRWTPHGTTLAGVDVPAEETIIVLLGAANRDPRRFTDPGRFDPARQHGQSLAFGAGPYFCLGAGLANLQAQTALPLLLRRFPHISPAEPPVRRASLALRGFDTLPVTVTPRQ
ncbi:MAG: cytochrome P450 [Kibdelosporangium sp.]